MKIAIVGLGFVGLSLAVVLASKNKSVIGIDIDEEKCKKIRDTTIPFYEPGLKNILKTGLKKNLIISNDFSLIKNCDMIFVTVGTPQKSNGEIELAMIKKATSTIGKFLKKNKNKPIIFIKSTVIPGTIQDVIVPILEKNSGKKNNNDFGIISNPEFLQESNAIHDTKFPHAIVLGGEDTKFMKRAERFFSKMFSGVPIIKTNYQSAEMIKYANNSFLATKITFINQLSNICQSIPGSNIDDIARGIGLDPRIGKLFLNAGPGYGGSCLPKDMKALINFSESIGITPTLLNAVEKTNRDQINNIISLLKKKLGSLSGKKITILGTSFKPNTDDIRDSKSIELIKKLLNNNAKITAHDPKALKNTKKIFNQKIKYENSMIDALDTSQCAIIMTHWKEYDGLNDALLRKMKRKFIIDCRRVLVNKKLDVQYYAIGVGEKI